MVRLSSLGDIVLATPLLRRLRETYPSARIDLLVKEQYRELSDCMPFIDNRIALPMHGGSREWMKTLKQTGYDTVIDLQNNLRTRNLIRRLNPKHLFRYHRPRFRRWKMIHLHSGIDSSIVVHTALGYLHTVSAVKDDDDKGLELKPPTDGSIARVHALLTGFCNEQHITYQKPLVIAPGAQHQTKMWLVQGWSELLKQAFDAGWKLQVLIGSRDELKIAEQIRQQTGHPLLVLMGELSLPDLTALLARADAAVTNDSGPMHLAAAAGAPLVALFGPTVTEFGFAPFRCNSEIVEIKDLKCRPCSAHGSQECPKEHFHCMRMIAPEVVLNAIRNVTVRAMTGHTSLLTDSVVRSR